MKKYTYELVIWEGSDEFWDAEPSDKEVTDMVIEAIEERGDFNVQREGGYEFPNATLKLRKMENEGE